jgi:ribA/ribD-fused uncharacterized protein
VANNIFPDANDEIIYFSRSDVTQELGTFSKHAFELEGKIWPSVEHYFQAMKFEGEEHGEKIRQAAHPKLARKLGRRRFKRMRKDWKQVKTTVMTRGLYIKCKTYPDIAEKLLNTEGKKLVENSQYDYFWGCGRDRRGSNMYGQVLMQVRDKLREETQT